MANRFPYWLPADVSAHGPAIDRLINLMHVFMLALFVGWGIYFIYCLVRFRARPDGKPEATKRFRVPTYVEVGVVVVEAVLLIFVSSPIWAKYKNEPPSEKEALVVQVTAEQFAWNVHYPGRDGKFGAGKIEKIDGTNPLGLDRAEPDAKDDIVSINEMHVPVGRPVIVHLRSKDVIHAFNIPSMRVKQDTIPGMTIPIWFTPTTIGSYDIACAQLCGVGHYRMRGQIVVEPPAAFAAWLAEQEKAQ